MSKSYVDLHSFGVSADVHGTTAIALLKQADSFYSFCFLTIILFDCLHPFNSKKKVF